ncbi:putative phosphotransferase with an alcohol group as acceptor [Helianthus annuus]|uniref:Inositol-tetrakisphosphate 1-kinase n=2 Tax=Helianthus annuus TaxID=4232 RepID=A0A251S3L7_HELAN|nr:putative phosphotransferase with an alcohol group as acceptor [Helianthus annuus]KAJ0444594.1 putative phosphotransferase with an alcohol group as acceptor [Helianthus annuus]
MYKNQFISSNKTHLSNTQTHNKMPESKAEKPCIFRVGYALPTRKTDAFMVEPFITYAKQRYIEFIPIDTTKPLTEQGPFDCIIHKLYGHEWNHNLEHFFNTNPNATIIDRPSAIQRLHNRISMLEPIAQLNIPNINIPSQLLIQDLDSFKNIQTADQTIYTTNQTLTRLTFPLIAKPLLADGSTNAHNMSLVLNHAGLTKGLKLDPPMVLQQFVNHGGVIFKVYVAGEYVKCVKRSSLPDVSSEMMEKMELEYPGGVMSFSQISSAVIAGDDAWDGDKKSEKPKMPEPEFVVEVANGLREALGLHLFNFDMIKDDKSDGYLVVDINYFPGYEKLPLYESVMVDFFLDVKKSQEEKKKMRENENKNVDDHDPTQA